MRKLRGEGDDADGKRPDQAADQAEEHALQAVQALVERLDGGGFLFEESDGDAEGSGNQHDRQDVAGAERLDGIVGDGGEDVAVDGIGRGGEGVDALRVFRAHRSDGVGGNRAGIDRKKEPKADEGRDEGGEHRQGEGFREDLAHGVAFAQGSEGGQNGKRDGGDSDELERARVGGGDEVHEPVEGGDAEGAENAAGEKRDGPENDLLEFHGARV